jgi:hypothetical protein
LKAPSEGGEEDASTLILTAVDTLMSPRPAARSAPLRFCMAGRMLPASASGTSLPAAMYLMRTPG